jgi:hypothetical protein
MEEVLSKRDNAPWRCWHGQEEPFLTLKSLDCLLAVLDESFLAPSDLLVLALALRCGDDFVVTEKRTKLCRDYIANTNST